MGTFSLNVARWVEATHGDVQKVVRKVALEALRRIVMKTPVRTGRARGNWFVGIGSLGGEMEQEMYDTSGGTTVSRGAGEIERATLGQSIWIYNNLSYIVRLEYGWSKQAPEGMIRTTMAELGGKQLD